MKKFIRFVIVISIILFVAVHFFNFDLGGAISAVKTVAFDTVEKVIPGSRVKFEDIDSQINEKIVKSVVAENLGEATKEALRNASSFFNQIGNGITKFAAYHGINLNFSFLHKNYSGSGTGSYSFDYTNVDLATATALRQQFIDYSMTLRGIPFVLGSENPERGLDCSAFVRYAAKNGINVQLPRTASEQYSAVELISSDEREPGDLLFFRRFGKIDHVGIYLGKYEGSGSLHGREIFINCASEGPRTGVVISALDEPYWRQHYSSSGKFLPSQKDVSSVMN